MGLECCQVTILFCKLNLMVTLFPKNLGKELSAIQVVQNFLRCWIWMVYTKESFMWLWHIYTQSDVPIWLIDDDHWWHPRCWTSNRLNFVLILQLFQLSLYPAAIVYGYWTRALHYMLYGRANAEFKLVVLQFPNFTTKHSWELVKDVMVIARIWWTFYGSRGCNMQHSQTSWSFTPKETASISSFQYQKPCNIHLPWRSFH